VDNLSIRGYHRLTYAAELLTCYRIEVIIVGFLDQSPGQICPPPVQGTLADRIEPPTFGAGARLPETAVEALPKRTRGLRCIVSELPAFVAGKLLPLLGGNETPPDRGIIAVRNVLAPGSRMHRNRMHRNDVDAK
jgi:hypothetical protein